MGNDSKVEVELTSIAEPSYLQAMHDTFSDKMEEKQIDVASAVLDEEARPITFEFNHCEFCRQMRRTEVGVRECRKSDRRGIRLAREAFKQSGKTSPVFWVCDRGLIDFCVPLLAGGQIVAYLFGGQFRGTFNNNGGELKTPDLPTLGEIGESTDLTTDTRTQYEQAFRQVQKLNQQEFDILREAAGDFGETLNGVIQKLYESKDVQKAEVFMQKAVEKHTIKALFDLIVNELPGMMDARYCSIFMIQEDEEGNERLVLRKTSYGKLQEEENSAYYEKGQGLTGWVWKHGESLRLKDIHDRGELASHGDDLEHRGLHNDSDEHKGFLAVPICGRGNAVIGVIRMPHKLRKPDEREGEEKGFTKHDEIFLNFLGRYLAWAIECQTAEDRFGRAIGRAGLVDAATKLGRARSRSQVIRATMSGSLALFGGKGTKHIVNRLEPDNQYWRVERVEGTLGLCEQYQDLTGMRFQVNQGVTGAAIHEQKAQLWSDIEASNKRGTYIPAAENGKSAMSAPMLCGTKTYGAISVVSDRKFRFSKEDDLIILDHLARLAGAALADVGKHRWSTRIARYVLLSLLRMRFLFRRSVPR